MNVAQQYTVGQRVTLSYWGKQRLGTVKELHAGSGAVRVEIDLATMHEWVQPEALTPVEPDDDPGELVRTGATVAFEYAGIPHYSPRRTLTGVVLDVRTRRDDVGTVQLYVKAPELNLPKWVDIDDVQFVGVAVSATEAALTA